MNSIKQKVLAIATIPFLLVAIILSISQISHRMHDVEFRLVSKAKNASNLLAKSVEYGIISGNKIYTKNILTDFVSQSDIINAEVFSEDGALLYSVDDPVTNQKNNSLPITITTDILRSTEEISDFEQSHNKQDTRIGILKIDISTESLLNEKQNIIIEGVIITLLLLIITITGTLIYIKQITNPFNQMLEGIDRIKEGNVGYQLESSSISELDILSRHINQMSLSLKHAQQQLLEKSDNEIYIERSKALVTLKAIGEGVITTDTNANITYINPAAEVLIGVRFTSVKGKNIHDILRIRDPDTEGIINYPIERILVNKETIIHDSHLILVKPDNSELVIKDTASPILDKSGELIGVALIFHDFSNIKRMSDKLAYQASHDDLTGLYNRREFERQLDESLKDSRRRNAEHTLCYLDLDQFKIINDTCGHMAGDILLKQISHQIQTRTRHHDIIARLGGDEFGIIFYDTNIKEAEALSETIKNSVSDFKYIWKENSFDVGVSIGIVPITANVESHSELMIRADSACYIAKENGRNCIHTYAESDKDFIRRCDELQWYNKIIEAVDNDRFNLFCQKILPANNTGNQSIHYEILLRMKNKENLILPAEFIPAAERYLLMPKIDAWVINAFFKEFEKHAIYNFGGNIYSINLSGQSLCSDEFLEFVLQRLQSKYVSPENLTFEITETSAISNLDKALYFITTMKKLGCKFALDDFGTGVSSFQYLHDLPIDYLKIDGKFVRNIGKNQINHSIIDAICKIGHELGLEIIAEYVENEQIMQKLKECNIDYLQGYALGYPFPLNELLS